MSAAVCNIFKHVFEQTVWVLRSFQKLWQAQPLVAEKLQNYCASLKAKTKLHIKRNIRVAYISCSEFKCGPFELHSNQQWATSNSLMLLATTDRNLWDFGWIVELSVLLGKKKRLGGGRNIFIDIGNDSLYF